MSQEDRILHFTIGPVQGFVAQARRTRDLWAGSFLLSWLSGCAMATLTQGSRGTVIFPNVNEDPLFVALQDTETEAGPRTGSLPNRFRARITAPDFDPCIVRDALIKKWCDLSTLVWECFVNPSKQYGCQTKQIWDQQIKSFWDTAWVIGLSDSEADDGAWLDQRKNWRSHQPSVEAGDHCMLMGDWQEISGWIRSKGGERSKQDDFWESIRSTVAVQLYGTSAVSSLELAAGERLCAIALVKRLFPVLFAVRDDQVREQAKSIVGFVPCGFGVPESARADQVRIWRSTAHIAVTPWLRRLVQDHKGAADEYLGKVSDLADKARAKGVLMTEAKNSVPGLEGHAIQQLDGRLFYHDALLQTRGESWGSPLNEDLDTRRALSAALRDVQNNSAPKSEANRVNKWREASPFYAVLIADGDRLGQLLKDPAIGGKGVSKALSDFTKFAGSLDTDGIMIYAGGDDFLGLFPLADVFSAAQSLRVAYQAAFAQAKNAGDKSGNVATLSAAIQIVPFDAPLSTAISNAHELLDNIAKEKNGRDSVAVRVEKGGAQMAQWVSFWGRDEHHLNSLIALAEAMAGDNERSSSFLYKLRSVYGKSLCEYSAETREKILLSEWLVGENLNIRNPDATQKKMQQAQNQISDLIAACTTEGESGQQFDIDGALIARFLADNGIGSSRGSV